MIIVTWINFFKMHGLILCPNACGWIKVLLNIFVYDFFYDKLQIRNYFKSNF